MTQELAVEDTGATQPTAGANFASLPNSPPQSHLFRFHIGAWHRHFEPCDSDLPHYGRNNPPKNLKSQQALRDDQVGQ
eukprot:10993610-Alexandrium_andersonii.AAC.1